jgi:mannosyltransferase OCH1-like enzyme
MNDKRTFPKIIHQTWKTTNIPKKWKISQKQWKKLHPTWEYRFWTDKDLENFIKDKHPEFLDIWKTYPYQIQKVDAVRYFILNDFGGIYSDLDIVPRLPLDEYVENMTTEAMFVPSANFQYMQCFTNAFMISHKGALIWQRVLDELSVKNKKWWYLGKHLLVMNTTGPYMLTRAIHKHDQILGYLPAKLFNAKSVSEIGDELLLRSDINKSDSVLINIYGCSWHEYDSKLYNFVFKYFIHILVIVTVIYFAWKHVKIY